MLGLTEIERQQVFNHAKETPNARADARERAEDCVEEKARRVQALVESLEARAMAMASSDKSLENAKDQQDYQQKMKSEKNTLPLESLRRRGRNLAQI